MIVPPTWIADTYLGRAPSGRSRVLRLSCYRESEEADNRAEFFVKAIGLPEITEQHLFNEAVGNLLARELGILTPDVGLIEIAEDFALSLPCVRKLSSCLSRPGWDFEPASLPR
jgi:hypothetical protein